MNVLGTASADLLAVQHIVPTFDRESIRAALACLGLLETHLLDGRIELREFGFEGSQIDVNDLIAVRANELSITLEPTKRCLSLVSALRARNVDFDRVCTDSSHGWPTLSVVASTTTVAGRGLVASQSPEGR